MQHTGVFRRENANACLLFENRINFRRPGQASAGERRSGTHTAESIDRAVWSTLFAKRRPGVMGPGFRRADDDYFAPTAFFRHARCTAQVQPGGWDATSLAGAAVGAAVGIASFTARTSAD